MSVAPRSKRSARAASRACAPTRSTFPRPRSRARAVEEEEALPPSGAGAVAPVQARDPLGGRGEQLVVVRRRSPSRRRSSPRAARSVDRRRGSRDSALPAARSVPRPPPRVVSSVGTTTIVRRSARHAVAQLRARAVGRGRTSVVTLRFTSATAAPRPGRGRAARGGQSTVRDPARVDREEREAEDDGGDERDRPEIAGMPAAT